MKMKNIEEWTNHRYRTCAFPMVILIASVVAIGAPVSAAAGKANVPSITFSNVKVTAVRDTSVIIRWETNSAAMGQVEYGLNTKYGKLTGKQRLSYWHSVKVAGLAPGTTYHYRIRAKDYKGRETISRDYTFATRTTGELENVIRAARKNKDLPNTYYVKPRGNDKDDGLLLKTAWATIQHAADTVQPGDTVLVQSGTYNEKVVIGTSGIAESRIVFKGVNNPVIDAGGGTGFQIKEDYVTVAGFSFKNANYGVWVFHADYANVSYNTMEDFSVKTGILVWGRGKSPYTPVYYPIVEHNKINTKFSSITLARGIRGGSVSHNILNAKSQGAGTLDRSGGGVSRGNQDPPAHGWCYRVDIVGNTVRNGRNGLSFGCMYRCYIAGNDISGYSHNALNLHGTQYSLIENNRIGKSHPGISNCHAIFPVAGSYQGPNNHDNVFRNNYVNGASGNGVYTYNTYNSVMENTTIDYCAGYGIVIIENRTKPHYTPSPGNWIFRNISFKINTSTGVAFLGTGGGVMGGNYYFANIRMGGPNLTIAWKIVGRGVKPTVHVINTNLTSTKWGGATGGEFRFYYPLDVKVIDAAGKPIEGATVTVTNDADAKYPSINYNWKNKTAFATGTDGHTPLPDDRKNSAAVMDFLKTRSGQRDFKYRIAVRKGGKKKLITDVDPGPHWYRSAPNKPTYTITAVLDGRTETEAQLKTKGLAGRPAVE